MNDIVIAGQTSVVQYIRVSTDHQRYSLENQRKAIADYALSSGYNIIDTYADAGRSGLTVQGRAGLIKLLHDVTDPNRRFSSILVLDVSRWGRFQDADQHAAYEFICREMGVRIEYVSEIFANDDSVATSLLKHMKRVMAGEYSRELSSKISRAQMIAAGKGFKQGGAVIYGFRRLLVTADGQPRAVLKLGETKQLSSDRVLIIPGPKEEADTIRRIFKMFTVDGHYMVTIARILNRDGVPTETGRPWTDDKIHRILTNTLCMGVYSYNKKSGKLKSSRKANPESEWVKVRIGKGYVSEATFANAQKGLALKTDRRFSDKKLLAGLAKLFKEKGRLSTFIINACPDIPSAATYVSHFGGKAKLYELVGYTPIGNQASACASPKQFRQRYSRDDLLAGLRRLLDENGQLSARLVKECEYTASPGTYHLQFGSLQNAYRAIGYEPRKRQPGRGSFWKLTMEQAAAGLKAVYDRHGYINTGLVNADSTIPTVPWYRRNFGSFANACHAAGIALSLGEKISEGHYRVLNRFGAPESQPRKKVHRMLPDGELIAGLRRLYATHGYVTGQLIDDDPDLPRVRDIYGRYASLKHLYAKAGVIGKTWKVRPDERS